MLKGKKILITGGSGEIGIGIAKLCLKNGAYVILSYNKNKNNIDKFIDEHPEWIDKISKLQLDLSDFKVTPETPTHVDGLVNCSGIHHAGPLISLTAPEIFEQIAVNLTGTILITQHFVKSMLSKRNGSIVNIGSVSAHRMFRGHSIYSASKAGVEGFTQALAAEVAKRGVRVNAVIPGPVQSPMLQKTIDETGDKPEERIPMQKLISTEDVANAVIFLLSDKAKMITGALLPVDGGYLLW